MKRFWVVILLCGGMWLPTAQAQDLSGWHYQVDTWVLPQADDTVDAVYADFTHLLKSTFKTTGTLEENSIRVLATEENQLVPFQFIKAEDYDAATNAAGTLLFQVRSTQEAALAKYRIYFDITQNGVKRALQDSAEMPVAVNMVWNGSFEILSEGYSGTNRYANAGKDMPRGWWGNLRNRAFADNLAKDAHSGQHALGLVAAPDKNFSVGASPSPPGLRVQAGQNYRFSFWIKGEALSGKYPSYSSVYWLGQDGKLVQRDSINLPVGKAADYDWTQVVQYLTAPDNVAFANLYIGTYSSTGILSVDEIEIRQAVPPLLQQP